MNCAQIAPSFGFNCHPISDDVLFVESPISLAFDGKLIGAYVQALGNGNVRISDNADTFFAALSHDIAINANKAKKLAEIASNCGIFLADNGELFITCKEDQTGFFLARLVEAAERIGFLCDGYRPTVLSQFEKVIANDLKPFFENRLKRNHRLLGASGHQLEFPFVIDPDRESPICVQTIALRDGKANWSSIYQTVGKMADIKNAAGSIRRKVILEAGDEAANRQAAVALAETASVIIYSGRDALITALAA